MALVLKCKTCGKRSARNYVTPGRVKAAQNNKEFKDCQDKGHTFLVEKVY